MTVRSFIASSLWRTRSYLWGSRRSNRMYPLYLRARRRKSLSLLCDSNTDLVVEAFPRSANTYLVSALALATNDALRIAHHLHDPVQLDRAARFEKPCVVILRNPLDAVVSWHLKRPEMDCRLMMAVYESFHAVILRHPQSPSFVSFEDVTGRTDATIKWICEKLLADHGLEPIAADREAVFHRIDSLKQARKKSEAASGAASFELSVARPTEMKELAKQKAANAVKAADPDRLQRIEALYGELRSRCETIV